MRVSICVRFFVTIGILGLVAGCGMALRMADSASTSGAIKDSGPMLQVENRTITLSAHLEVSRPSDGTGVMVLKLTTAGEDWPHGLRLSQIGFRPQSANYYFNYINVNQQGHATRITRNSAFSPQIEPGKDAMEIRFRILRLVDKPYEVQVNLRDATERVFSFGVRGVEQQ